MSERDRALALVRSMRRQLESLRLLRGASRGALAGAALGLVLVLLDKLSGAEAVPPSIAWSLTFAGAVGMAVATALRPSVPAASAALYLDRRCATEERFVTLWSLPDDAHAAEWAAGVRRVTRAPRVALPREAALLPLALFLLFGAGLLPSAHAAEPEPVAGVTSAQADAAPAPPADEPAADAGRRIDEAARRLREAAALDVATAESVARAIDEGFVRPEERAAAHAELNKARGGDRAARERLAKALLEGAGALGETRQPPVAAPRAGTPERPGMATSSPYADEAAFLRAYDVELARLTSRGKG